MKAYKIKLGGFIFIACLATLVISMKCTVIFRRPLFGNISSEQDKIRTIDSKLYEVLQRVDVERADLYKAIKKEDFDLNWRTQIADNLYKSIPQGEIIKRGYSSAWKPVGTYKKVVEQRKEIEKDRKKWQMKKDSIAGERGALVDNEEVKVLWAKRLLLMKVVDEYDERVDAYNWSVKGVIYNFLYGLFFWVGVGLGTLGMMLGFSIMFNKKGS